MICIRNGVSRPFAAGRDAITKVEASEASEGAAPTGEDVKEQPPGRPNPPTDPPEASTPPPRRPLTNECLGRLFMKVLAGEQKPIGTAAIAEAVVHSQRCSLEEEERIRNRAPGIMNILKNAADAEGRLLIKSSPGRGTALLWRLTPAGRRWVDEGNEDGEF